MKLRAQKILVIGADGYIGHALNRKFRSLNCRVTEAGLASSKRDDYLYLDIRNADLAGEVIGEVRPDVIVHAAGISSLQACEADNDLAYESNVRGTEHIVKAIQERSPLSRLVFLSSDYVFDGATGGYTENSPKNPTTYYGKTKAESEDRILAALPGAVIIRTSNVYGRGGKFFSFLMENLRKGVPVDLYTDTHYTPTYLDFLAAAVVALLRKDFAGLIHVAGHNRLSRFEFGKKAADAIGADGTLVKPTTQGEGGLVARDSSLDVSLAHSLLNVFNPSPEQAFDYLLGRKEFPYFQYEDPRGAILGLSRNGLWREINHATSKAGTIRGNHWHRETQESFFIIRGSIRVVFKDCLSGVENEFMAGEGDFFSIPIMTSHTFHVQTDSEWVNLLSSPMDEDAPDILR